MSKCAMACSTYSDDAIFLETAYCVAQGACSRESAETSWWGGWGHPVSGGLSAQSPAGTAQKVVWTVIYPSYLVFNLKSVSFNCITGLTVLRQLGVAAYTSARQLDGRAPNQLPSRSEQLEGVRARCGALLASLHPVGIHNICAVPGWFFTIDTTEE